MDATGTAAFGQGPNGEVASLYTLTSGTLRARITNYGGRLVSVEAPDRSGKTDHVVLGFESLDSYIRAGSFGALLGRYANRIAGGRFTLDGETFDLVRNEGDNTLHGGSLGFNKVFWSMQEVSGDRLVLALTSPDGDQGFPGEVTATATYHLQADTLTLTLEAQASRPTPLNLSAHPYFNLAGAAAIDILDHEVTIAADHFLPTDDKQIPTGEIRAVAGTPFDFQAPVLVGSRIRQPDPQLLLAKGYDHHFVFKDGAAGASRPVVSLRHPATGRTLDITTTQPGVQFYTGNNLNGSVVGRGGAYRQAAGIAFEPQGFPNAPNQPNFPTAILRPGMAYREVIAYRFGVR